MEHYQINYKGVFLGGGTPSKSNVIEYITIAAEGNAIDFGDLSYAADAQIGGVVHHRFVELLLVVILVQKLIQYIT